MAVAMIIRSAGSHRHGCGGDGNIDAQRQELDLRQPDDVGQPPPWIIV
jgi:hypothetical protein